MQRTALSAVEQVREVNRFAFRLPLVTGRGGPRGKAVRRLGLVWTISDVGLSQSCGSKGEAEVDSGYKWKGPGRTQGHVGPRMWE